MAIFRQCRIESGLSGRLILPTSGGGRSRRQYLTKTVGLSTISGSPRARTHTYHAPYTSSSHISRLGQLIVALKLLQQRSRATRKIADARSSTSLANAGQQAGVGGCRRRFSKFSERRRLKFDFCGRARNVATQRSVETMTTSSHRTNYEYTLSTGRIQGGLRIRKNFSIYRGLRSSQIFKILRQNQTYNF